MSGAPTPARIPVPAPADHSAALSCRSCGRSTGLVVEVALDSAGSPRPATAVLECECMSRDDAHPRLDAAELDWLWQAQRARARRPERWAEYGAIAALVLGAVLLAAAPAGAGLLHLVAGAALAAAAVLGAVRLLSWPGLWTWQAAAPPPQRRWPWRLLWAGIGAAAAVALAVAAG